MTNRKPLLLAILDGWGVGEPSATNAVYVARTPNMDDWGREYALTTLAAHNGAVGLPEGQMGNSEVGHMNIGAGRVVYQDFTRINMAIKQNELADNPVLLKLIDQTKEAGKALHLMGLLSDGGVHSHIKHLLAILNIAAVQGLKKVFIHCFMDGRDTPPKSGKSYIEELEAGIKAAGVGRIATIIGRYYAMDRDKHWERVERAWQAMVDGKGIYHQSPAEAVSAAYAAGTTDEFIEPIVIGKEGRPLALIEDDDTVLFFNFRADRARQLTHAFNDEEFNDFHPRSRPRLGGFVTCTSYEKNLKLPVLFPPSSLDHILGEEVSRHGLRQLRIAETEKYAHVTYFFNGGREQPFSGEDRALIESPREVATYDLKPEMSACKITDELLRRMRDNPYSLIVLNFANGDMVGHSGILTAAVKACEVVDECLGRLAAEIMKQDGVMMITADHGNADIMYDDTINEPHTAHTLNPVPFLLMADRYRGTALRDGGALCDIAPTVLEVLKLPVPAAMTGSSLIIS